MKKYIIPVAAFIAGMAIVPSVFALDNNPTYEYDNWSDLANNCLCKADIDDGTVCKLTKDFEYTDAGKATVAKNVTLDLGNHTLTVKGASTDGLMSVSGNLTITNGHIKVEDDKKLVAVASEGSFTLTNTADIKGGTPIDANNAESIVVNGNVEAQEGKDAITVKTTSKETTVEINGQVAAKGAGKAYIQSGDVAATIKGRLTAKTGSAMNITGGSLVMTGATVTSDASAVVFGGKVSTVAINGCSKLVANKADAALWFSNSTSMESLTIADSTLQSMKGHTINGGATKSTVEEVNISGSVLLAGTDKEIKAGNIEFDAAEYDGTAVAEKQNVLSATKGSYGTLAAVCGGSAAADEGEEGKEDGAENPNTADTIATYLTIATVALLGLGATAFVAKKSNR